MPDLQLCGREILAWRSVELKLGGSAQELDWLLEFGGGLARRDLQLLFIDPDRMVGMKQPLCDIDLLWKQFLDQNIPLQHLVGICPWRDLMLEVGSAALIPRQESELLLDLALAIPRSAPVRRWADLGTGSGALAISLARALPKAAGHAVDQSAQALAIAERNFRSCRMDPSLALHQGSWWEPLSPWFGGFDLVLSNPPYIPSGLIDRLHPTVRDHEPRMALDGGSDGLDCIRIIVAGAAEALAPGGWLLLEHHHDHSQRVLALLQEQGLSHIGSASDLSGIVRFAMACRVSDGVKAQATQVVSP